LGYPKQSISQPTASDAIVDRRTKPAAAKGRSPSIATTARSAQQQYSHAVMATAFGGITRSTSSRKSSTAHVDADNTGELQKKTQRRHRHAA
ncbi:hypothetical protein Dimus_013079, partial [Dionaea muscipula]